MFNKKHIYTILALLLFALNSFAAEPDSTWWSKPYPVTFDKSTLKPQSFITVKGNGFINEAGEAFIFRGFSLADPDKLAKQGKWDIALFKEAVRWGVNTLRLPIHPSAWRARGTQDYLKLIDQAVVWANQLGIYLIIDWHSIGYLPNELYQHTIYDTTLKETYQFWRRIAFRYQDIPTTAVYEIFNEPTTQGGTLGKRNWSDWKTLNETIIDMIYAHDKRVIPLVAGFNWAYDLRDIKHAPIEREGIAYAVHPYPQKARPVVKSKANFFKAWDEVWGFAAKTYPMIATELGWAAAGSKGAHVPTIDNGSYGPRIIEYFQKHNISWIVWVFDPDWYPVMIEDWKFTPSTQGKFFKKALLKAQAKERKRKR